MPGAFKIGFLKALAKDVKTQADHFSNGDPNKLNKHNYAAYDDELLEGGENYGDELMKLADDPDQPTFYPRKLDGHILSRKRLPSFDSMVAAMREKELAKGGSESSGFDADPIATVPPSHLVFRNDDKAEDKEIKDEMARLKEDPAANYITASSHGGDSNSEGNLSDSHSEK